MKVEVLVFAGLRELFGTDVVKVEVDDDTTYSELIDELIAISPSAAPLLQVSRLAAGGEFVAREAAIDPSEEIAIIPPVSGG